MSTEKDGGSAFPEVVTDFDYHGPSDTRYANTYSYGGMSLRDWFAGQASAGLMANPEFMGQAARKISANGKEESIAEYLARNCFDVANAMLAERAKEKLCLPVSSFKMQSTQ